MRTALAPPLHDEVRDQWRDIQCPLRRDPVRCRVDNAPAGWSREREGSFAVHPGGYASAENRPWRKDNTEREESRRLQRLGRLGDLLVEYSYPLPSRACSWFALGFGSLRSGWQRCGRRKLFDRFDLIWIQKSQEAAFPIPDSFSGLPGLVSFNAAAVSQSNGHRTTSGFSVSGSRNRIGTQFNSLRARVHRRRVSRARRR